MLPISVIIPTYNRAHVVGRAITSALNQICPGDEIIVVDDGSTDDTEKSLSPFIDKITYIRTKNAGAGAARNRGVKEARNPLVAFLDSDDEWMPGKLELQRRLMQARPDVLFSFSEFAVATSQGEKIHRYLRRWHADPRSWDEILGRGVPYSTITSLPPSTADFKVHCGSMYVPMAAACYVPTFTVVVRRLEAGDALHFEEGVPTYEDWFCFGRLSGRGMAAFLDIETAWN